MSSTLFERLGGAAAVRAVVENFYQRLLDDDALAPFFANTSMTALKLHQFEFLKIAFSAGDEAITAAAPADIPQYLMDKHKVLFQDMGLNAEHFDLVAGHLVATCQEMQVPADLIDEAVAIVVPLRAVFEQGAELYGGGESKQDDANTAPPLQQGTLLHKLGGTAALKAAVEEMYTRLLDDPETSVFFEDLNMAHLKQHQIDFMKIAFTVIPDDLDVPALLTKAHQRLFDEKNLQAKHFDIVAKHLVGALESLSVPQQLIDEVVATVGPLRVVFEQGEAAAAKKE